MLVMQVKLGKEGKGGNAGNAGNLGKGGNAIVSWVREVMQVSW